VLRVTYCPSEVSHISEPDLDLAFCFAALTSTEGLIQIIALSTEGDIAIAISSLIGVGHLAVPTSNEHGYVLLLEFCLDIDIYLKLEGPWPNSLTSAVVILCTHMRMWRHLLCPHTATLVKTRASLVIPEFKEDVNITITSDTEHSSHTRRQVMSILWFNLVSPQQATSTKNRILFKVRNFLSEPVLTHKP
jgi:hypothetical protein